MIAILVLVDQFPVDIESIARNLYEIREGPVKKSIRWCPANPLIIIVASSIQRTVRFYLVHIHYNFYFTFCESSWLILEII